MPVSGGARMCAQVAEPALSHHASSESSEQGWAEQGAIERECGQWVPEGL